MTTISQLLARRYRTAPAAVQVKDSLNAMRYEALRSLSPKQFTALHRSALLHHKASEDFERAFDRMVDVLILTDAAREKEGAT